MNMELQFLKLQASGNIRYISLTEIIYLKGRFKLQMQQINSKKRKIF